MAWHSMAPSGHSRAGQGYVKATHCFLGFGLPMRRQDRTDKELIELIHQVQLEGLRTKLEVKTIQHWKSSMDWTSTFLWNLINQSEHLGHLYHVGFLKPSILRVSSTAEVLARLTEKDKKESKVATKGDAKAEGKYDVAQVEEDVVGRCIQWFCRVL